MANLKDAAQELDTALTAVREAVQGYYEMAVAVGRDAGDPTALGLDARQLRQKLQQFVIARLSPKPGHGEKPILQFDSAPQARRYVVNHPLPGLS